MSNDEWTIQFGKRFWIPFERMGFVICVTVGPEDLMELRVRAKGHFEGFGQEAGMMGTVGMLWNSSVVLDRRLGAGSVRVQWGLEGRLETWCVHPGREACHVDACREPACLVRSVLES